MINIITIGFAGLLIANLFLVIGLLVPYLGTVFELDLDQYKEWTAEQLYYLIFPHIKKDFMGIKDCKMVHADGNLMAGESTVSHITTQGGSNTFTSIKEQIYNARLEAGEVTLETAKETGRFMGR
jgi:hypothetical protein